MVHFAEVARVPSQQRMVYTRLHRTPRSVPPGRPRNIPLWLESPSHVPTVSKSAQRVPRSCLHTSAEHIPGNYEYIALRRPVACHMQHATCHSSGTGRPGGGEKLCEPSTAAPHFYPAALLVRFSGHRSMLLPPVLLQSYSAQAGRHRRHEGGSYGKDLLLVVESLVRHVSFSK